MAGLQPKLPVLIKKTVSSLTIRREPRDLQYKLYGALEKENFVSDSPVLEAWSRWDEIRFSKGKDVFKTVELYTATNRLTSGILKDYMSGGYAEIPNTLTALTELLRVSDMLLIPDLKQFCIDCIIDITVDEANCFEILETSSVYNFEHPGMNKYIRGHLLSLARSKQMLNVSYDSLQYLLNDEELSYWPEDDRFVLITNWCKALNDRLSRFQLLFDSLDLNKMNRDILCSALNNNELVRESRAVTLKINEFLQLEEKENIPIVCFIGYEIRGSNLLGFNMEDKKIFRLNFPHTISYNNIVTSNCRGNIILCQDGKLHEYDVTTNECNERNILLEGKKFASVTHVLYEENLIFIGINHCKQSQSLVYRHPKAGGKECTLYCVKTSTEQDLELQPVLSFAFGISCACVSGSKIFLTTTVYKHKGQVMCYDLVACSLCVIYRLCTSYMFDGIKRMLPMQDQLLLITNERILSISRTDYSENVFQEVVGTSIGNPIYGQLSETVIEICNKNIRLIEIQAQDPNKLSIKITSCTPEHFDDRLNITHAIGGRLPRTKPMCHIMCPHCDPNAWEKEEAEKNRLLELERQRLQRLTLYSPTRWSDDDYDYNDYYDNDNEWSDKPEMIWDGSADEFVEAWW